jgi:hypothetical protein
MGTSNALQPPKLHRSARSSRHRMRHDAGTSAQQPYTDGANPVPLARCLDHH